MKKRFSRFRVFVVLLCNSNFKCQRRLWVAE